jgi:3-hydroxyisobutyrate dehydrogenase
MQIGFIGLGAMGLPMFRNLTKCYPEAIGFDLSQDARARAISTGLKIASDLSEFRDVQIIITMLPNGAAVRNCLLGPSAGVALIPGLIGHGSTVIDMSSSSPLDTTSLANDLAGYGVELADAPVSGSVPKATEGSLSIMLGASDEVARRITPVLESMGKTIIRTGGVSTAHSMKALNNYVYAAGLMAASEALILGRALGLDLQKLVDVLNCSSGRNVATETKLRQHMLEGGDFAGGFGLRLMAKDLAISHGLQERVGFQPEQLDLCYRTWKEACTSLDERADNLEIARFLEERLVGNKANAA